VTITKENVRSHEVAIVRQVNFKTAHITSVITSKVCQLNVTRLCVHLQHHYVMMFIADLWIVSGFLQVIRFLHQ